MTETQLSELSSIADQLYDLTARVSSFVDGLDPDDEQLADLTEIERQLQTANRRLDKFLNT